MAHYLDDVPFSGIIRIRDLMYTVKDPFRLDQGDVSFDAPDTLKAALIRAVHDNRTHYLQTTGLPALQERLADKMQRKNGVPIHGVVTHLASFGVFVEIQPGVEGLVHLSELAEGEFGSPANVVKEGDELDVLSVEFEQDGGRIHD